MRQCRLCRIELAGAKRLLESNRRNGVASLQRGAVPLQVLHVTSILCAMPASLFSELLPVRLTPA